MDIEEDREYEGEEEINLPALSQQILAKTNYSFEAFVSVTEEMSPQEATASDLAVLNNHLAFVHGALPFSRDIDDICKLSLTAVKLIEARRRVKGLPYGAKGEERVLRTFEVIE